MERKPIIIFSWRELGFAECQSWFIHKIKWTMLVQFVWLFVSCFLEYFVHERISIMVDCNNKSDNIFWIFNGCLCYLYFWDIKDFDYARLQQQKW